MNFITIIIVSAWLWLSMLFLKETMQHPFFKEFDFFNKAQVIVWCFTAGPIKLLLNYLLE